MACRTRLRPILLGVLLVSVPPGSCIRQLQRDPQTVPDILAKVTNFVMAGAARDNKIYDQVSAACTKQSEPFESKVRAMSASLADFQGEIKEQEAVKRLAVVPQDVYASISELKGDVSRLSSQLDDMDALHKSTSETWEAHRDEMVASVRMLSPYMRQFQAMEAQEQQQGPKTLPAFLQVDEVPVHWVQRQAHLTDQPASQKRLRTVRAPQVRFRELASRLSDGKKQPAQPAAAKPLQSVDSANGALLQALQQIQARMLQPRASQASYERDRKHYSPKFVAASTRLTELEARRDALLKAHANATASIQELQSSRGAVQTRYNEFKAQLDRTTATCELYLAEFKGREQDRVKVMTLVQKLKAQALAAVNNILMEKVVAHKDSPAEQTCCPCKPQSECGGQALCAYCLKR